MPTELQVEVEPERLYAEALSRRDAIQAEWVRLEAPLLAQGSMGQMVEHPLVKMLREHEVLVARLGELVRKRHSGPQPSAVLKSGAVPKSRGAGLRAVGD